VHVITPLTPFVYKMRAKLKKEGFQCPSFPMSCWHIDEKTHPHVGLNTQKPLQLEGKTCPLQTNRDKDCPLHELQLSQ
jgi:hypothetical protein